MYVIVETGSKQYRLSNNDIFEVERLDAARGKTIKLDKVLLYSGNNRVEIGRPYLKNVKVACEVLAGMKGRKVVSFKYKRRKSSRTKIGHRQAFTRLKVKEIIVEKGK